MQWSYTIDTIGLTKIYNSKSTDLYKNKKRQTSNQTDLSFLVGLPGFEPGQTEPKTVVLPLHNNPIR